MHTLKLKLNIPLSVLVLGIIGSGVFNVAME